MEFYAPATLVKDAPVTPKIKPMYLTCPRGIVRWRKWIGKIGMRIGCGTFLAYNRCFCKAWGLFKRITLVDL